MSISLISFFKTNFNNEVLKNKVVCFRGNEYPNLFFSLLLKALKPNSLNTNFININNLEFSTLKLQLEQSFLGVSLFYWLGNISDYKNKKDLISYLNSYQGVHFIGFFVNDEKLESYFERIIINCDNAITIEQFHSLLVLWPSSKHNMIQQFIKKIFEKNSKLSLDQFCIFVNYALLLGNKYSNFMDDWLEKILINEHSFFTLSKYFFAFDSKSFYKYWNSISEDYMPIFWITYWSEQLYRSYNFIYLRDQGKNLQAKQIAYKLPFSFIQGDWKKTSLNELSQAHQFIYDIDYAIKNGASEFCLDLFYAKFFSREFSKNYSEIKN